jgi:hypothetical protein
LVDDSEVSPSGGVGVRCTHLRLGDARRGSSNSVLI